LPRNIFSYEDYRTYLRDVYTDRKQRGLSHRGLARRAGLRAHSSVSGGQSNATFTSVTVDATNAVYAAGGIGGQGVVDLGNDVTVTGTEVPTPGWSTLLVKYQ